MLKLIFVKLLEISIQASFFILAIMFIRLCFKQMPKRYICILWALLAIRLILPIEITSTFSLVPDTSRLQQLSEISNDDSANHTEKLPMQGSSGVEATYTEKIPAQSSSGVEATYTEKIPAQDSSGVVSTHTYKKGPGTVMVTIDIVHLLSFLWLAGFIGFIGYGIISYLHLKHSLKEAVSDIDNIWYSEKIPSPFVLGYIKPRIYIPFSIEKEQLPYIIAHEKAHIAHLDHLCKLIGFVLLCIYWFNPFIWKAYQLYCKDLELACDERVIDKLGADQKKPYSEALLACSITNKALLKSPLAFSETAIKERILNVLNYRKPSFWAMLLAIILCIVASICFLTNAKPNKTKDFIEQTTIEILDQVILTYLPEHGFHELPETLGPDAYYLIHTSGTEELQFYGLVNGEGMILRDGDTLYSLYDVAWPELDANENVVMRVYKSDYDSDNSLEYALHKLDFDENGNGFLGLTMLEIEDTSLHAIPFTRSDMLTQLERISFEYADDEEKIYVYIDTEEPQAILDTSWVNQLYEQSYTRLQFGNATHISIPGIDQQNMQWKVTTNASFLKQKVDNTFSLVAISFNAPVTYSADGKFLIGDISIDYLNINPPYLTLYAEQLADFPGNALVTDEEQLAIAVSAKDYECVVATDPATNKPVYVWSEGSDKEYPLEVINGKVQDVPAKIILEKDIAKYAFGDNLLGMTYKLHPYGTKQYILRENGMVNVNIAYESEGHVDFHYLTFQTNEAQQTALLTDYGLGYYLLQSNDVNALKAFRKAYTGAGHTLPSDTSHLPWDWLLELNNEVNDTPKLKSNHIPVVTHRYDYTDFTSYNLNDSYNGFVIAEKRIDEEVFIEYHYHFKEEDLVILTDLNDSRVISITYNGEEKPLPDQILRVSRSGGNGYDTVYYVDETGDGQQELIFESAGGGTGAWDSSCYIFNPDTMEQYPIDLDVFHITSNLKITLTEMEPEGGYNSLHFTIEYEDQKKEGAVSFDNKKHAAMLKPDVTLEEANAYFDYTPDKTTHNIAYNSETGRIETEVWIWIDNTAFQQYIGAVRAAYTWDEAIGKFVIDPDSVVIWGND